MLLSLLPMLRELASAMSRRIGTAFSSFMVAQGIPNETAEQVYLAVAVLAGLLFDMALAHYHERNR